jgi:hypothetical protein
MFGLAPGPDYPRGIVGDGRVRWWASWDREGFAPSSRVGGNRLNEAHEVVGGERRVVDGVFRVRNVEQERIQDVTECREIVIAWLSGDGLESSSGGGEGRGDFLGRHFGVIGARKRWPRYRMRQYLSVVGCVALRRGLRRTGIAGVGEVLFTLRWHGGMRRIGVCAGVMRWAGRRLSGCCYDLVGMTKSTMVVV